MPRVSVIMPVYNTGKYLRETVDSLLKQTFRDFELILVDDGSTDGSGDACDAYAAKDPRVRVKHGRNGGICASRNAGLELARGEWVAFSDHDDYVEPDMLATLVAAAGASGAPLVKCNHVTLRRAPDGKTAPEFSGWRRASGDFAPAELLTPGDIPFFKFLAGTIWDGLYLRSHLESRRLRFDTRFKYGGEDCDFMVRLLATVDRLAWVETSLYRHYYNIGTSTSSGFHPELLEDYLRTAKLERELFPAAFADVNARFASFAEWTVPAIHFVFRNSGGRVKYSERSRWIRRYYGELVGAGARPRMAGLPLKRKLLLAAVRTRLEIPYLILKNLALAFRKHRGML